MYINAMKNTTRAIGYFLILLLAFGCSGNSNNTSDLEDASNVAVEKDIHAESDSDGIKDMLDGVASDRSRYVREEDRKLIRWAHIKIKVEDLEAADISVTSLMEKYNAYSSSTEFEKSSYRYTIRVPAAAYKDILTGVDSIGTVLKRSEYVEDATVRYYDLEGRLETQKELLKTFQSYLGKTKNIEEIMSVEKRIAELQNNIDETGKVLRNFSRSIDFSEINLVILGPVIISPSSPNPVFIDRIKVLFSDFSEFLSDLAVVFIYIIIYGTPILLLALFFYWIFFGKIGILKRLWWTVSGKKF